MGIDAVAVLRIRKLKAPRDALGSQPMVDHLKDCSLVHTFVRFDSLAADEHALVVRRIFGAQLDQHDDPRGILFFPDVCEPKRKTYDAIVREVEAAGVWAPKVEADHVAARFTQAAPDSHEALVAQMIGAMGRDAATQLDMMAQVHLMVMGTTERRPDAVADYQAAMAQLTLAMGSEFAGRYERSLRAKVDADRAAQQARHEQMQQMWARAESGEPLVSEQDLGDFLNSDAGADLLKELSADLQEALKGLGKKP